MGCGDSTQAILCLMRSRAHCGQACALEISELEPGVYSVTEMRTTTGEQETSRLQTMAGGTLAVLAGGGAQDVALALVRVGDPA
jgi:hypothetical protein